jgi:hypothetical protein
MRGGSSFDHRTCHFSQEGEAVEVQCPEAFVLSKEDPFPSAPRYGIQAFKQELNNPRGVYGVPVNEDKHSMQALVHIVARLNAEEIVLAHRFEKCQVCMLIFEATFVLLN